jgi:hypothetical protein
MSLTLSAGLGVVIDGNNAIFERERMAGITTEGVNFMIGLTGVTGGLGVAIAAFWKDTFIDSNYYTLVQNNSGALVPWSRTIADPGNGITLYFSLSIPFPENANFCVLKITGESANTITIKAIGNIKNLR